MPHLRQTGCQTKDLSVSGGSGVARANHDDPDMQLCEALDRQLAPEGGKQVQRQNGNRIPKGKAFLYAYGTPPRYVFESASTAPRGVSEQRCSNSSFDHRTFFKTQTRARPVACLVRSSDIFGN